MEKKIECLERQTKNKEIGKILATAPSKTVSDIDGIKDIISTLKPERINSIVLTSSLFNTLNKLKDSTGQDILSVNKTNYSSSTFFVNYFLVVSDTILGNAGDKKAFIGDIENFATLFDYEKSSISWNTQYLIYGSSLRFTSRFDVEKVNSDCGYLVEWS
ncbi:phage major capsid protein [Streptococcus uberis]|uniref:phage major capsid protein n=1 Tax=Streptococcus uberis TaxID=1349 RepID=UPI0027DAFB3E|nr:phage major capsid protein [Streptococcus uberis]MCK1192971.1 phage major capsid protein [Streptococcus uberis]MCK1244590.1 phage major capsid protein [Streptococcus uberis]MCK1246873.1 phage major capsid protein [Streptococcus uberis]